MSKSEFEELKSKHSLYEFPEEDDLSEKNVSDTNFPMPNLLKFHDSYPECGNPCSRNNYEFYCNLHPEVYIHHFGLDTKYLFYYYYYMYCTNSYILRSATYIVRYVLRRNKNLVIDQCLTRCYTWEPFRLWTFEQFALYVPSLICFAD